MKALVTILKTPKNISSFEFITYNEKTYDTMQAFQNDLKQIGPLSDMDFVFVTDHMNIYDIIQHKVYLINYIKE